MNAKEFKKQVTPIVELWSESQFDKALELIEKLLKKWPGNTTLMNYKAAAIQLSEKNNLNDAKTLLNNIQSIDESIDSYLKLAHFTNNIENNKKEANQLFEKAINKSMQALTESLIGYSKTCIDTKQDKNISKLIETLNKIKSALSPHQPITSQS